MYLKSLLAVCLMSQVVTADRDLPVLFQFSQPSHNVAVFRGADLEKAKAAGLIKGFGGAAAKKPAPAPATAAPAAYKPAPTPAYKPAPAPVVYKPAPAPVVYRPAPAPVVYRPAPAPVVYRPAPTPAPVVYKPAPIVYKPAPAPVVYKPAPTPAPVVYKPAPVVYKPAPAYKPAASYVEPAYNDADALYTWEYAVKDDYSNNDFGHKEARDGAHTDGKYYVALPDGRLQTVTYTVDGYGGYVPVVEYSGEPQYPVESAYSA